jgi:ribosomal protein L24
MENEKRDEAKFLELMAGRGWKVDPWAVQKGDRVRVIWDPDGGRWGDVANTTTGTVERRFSVYVEQGEGEPAKLMVYAARTDRDLIPDDAARTWGDILAHLKAAEVATVPKAKKPRKEKAPKSEPSFVPELPAGENAPGLPEGAPEEKDKTDQGLPPALVDEPTDGQALLLGAFGTIDQEIDRVEGLRTTWESALEALEESNEQIAVLKEELKPVKKRASDARAAYKAGQRELRKLQRQQGGGR